MKERIDVLKARVCDRLSRQGLYLFVALNVSSVLVYHSAPTQLVASGTQMGFSHPLYRVCFWLGSMLVLGLRSWAAKAGVFQRRMAALYYVYLAFVAILSEWYAFVQPLSLVTTQIIATALAQIISAILLVVEIRRCRERVTGGRG
jgi:ABC-type proline/glycine betaine transport system permease subunit